LRKRYTIWKNGLLLPNIEHRTSLPHFRFQPPNLRITFPRQLTRRALSKASRFEFPALEGGLIGNVERSGKAAEDSRSPRRYREIRKRVVLRQLLECGSPLPLCGLTRRDLLMSFTTPSKKMKIHNHRNRPPLS